MPDSPQDDQTPMPNRQRPSLVVVWLGARDVPPSPAATPVQSGPPLTLYAEDVGAFYRRLRKRLFD